MEFGRPGPSPISFTHTSEVYSVRACQNDNAPDLLALGTVDSVEILQRDETLVAPSFKSLTSFYIGTPVKAIAWSARTVSPGASKKWLLELVVVGLDNKIRLLFRSPRADATVESEIRTFGGGPDGHRKAVNDICFCSTDTYQTRLASVGDDGLLVWNLYPKPDDEEGDEEGNDTEDEVEQSLDFNPRSRGTASSRRGTQNTTIANPAPTSYMIRSPHPLRSISSHPSSANEFMISDTHGTVSIVDWTRLDEDGPTGWRGHRVVELTEPRTMTSGSRGTWTGAASWKRDDQAFIGATYGSRWCVWDRRKLHGGKPIHMGDGFSQGGDQFRWCPTDPHLFVISTASPITGATVKIFRTTSPHSPRQVTLQPRPHRVRDIDWLGALDPEDASRAWLAVAVGRNVFFIQGGDPSR